MSLEARDDLFNVLEEFESVFVEISDEWMKICFESNFTEFEQFSQFVRLSILGNIDVVALLIRLSGALLRFEKSAGENSTEIWEELSKRNMNAQKLVVFLWYLIERALIQNSALEEQKIGLCAAGAYLALCSLSASQAFNIFNAALYQKVLEILRTAYRLLTYDGVRNEGNRSRQGKASGAAKRKRTDDSLSALQNSTIVHLSGESKREVTEMLFDALDSLFALLDEVSLSASPEAVLGSALLIRDLMTIDFSSNISVAASPCRRLSEFQSLRRFSERSFALMHRLIEPRHSSCSVLLGHIVMPRLVFWTFENTTLPASAHPTKLMNDYKDAMIRFIKFRIEKGDEDELSVIQRVLENVCHRCPDRSDYRTKVASTVCEILALMPLKYHYDFAHFIRVFGSVDRGAWRGFAVEMIPLLLLNFGTSFLVSNFTFIFSTRTVSTSFLLQWMRTMFLNFSSPDPSTQQNTTNGHGNIVVKTEPGEENANDREDDDGSVNQKKKKRKRPKKGSPVERQNPLVALVTVMVRSCNDKSSMVRSRAIVQMIDVLKNDRMRAFLSDISTEMAKLNLGEEESQENRVGVREESCADSPLLEMLLVRCNDSRVSVRKAAMQSVEAYCTCLNDRTLINLAVNAIKQGSHDTALSVRKQSAESLTHLLLSMSGNRAELSELLETSWLCSVMPLVVDREQSVVQLASRLINETMIQPIATNSNDLAWRLLAAVEQNLDYQRALLRALMNEAKDGNLTERIVNVLWKKVDEVDKSTMAWMLLHELCAIFKIDPSRAVDVWFKRVDDEHRDTV
ncbi:unnamed protein product, partial [Anisakis simplex]|uniref:Condensin-2 complex subunit D3 (inferred by orthology to a human protein) n=1 Tax=Anisakis simplex TaxID=6269 RepID=A0A0M3K5M9_ANISI